MLPPPPLIPDLIGVANASDLSTAFAQGQAMGAAGKAAAQSNITAGQAANVVPNYTSSATESSYFSGGQGSLSGPALSKVSGCASGAPNPDPYKRQECEAVNFLAKNPAQRQQFGIGKSDPLLAGAKPILANPSALAGSMDGSYSACSTQTVEQPAQYSTEVCNQYADMAQSTCQRVLKVTATQPQPIPATPNYSCLAGQTLFGVTCVQPATSATVGYSCPSGSALSGTSCQAPAYQPAGIAASASYNYAPAGGEISSNCWVNWWVSENGIIQCWDGSYSYSCPSGYTLSGTTCYPPLVTPPPTAATVNYSCPAGITLSGTTCQPPATTAAITYTCGPGATLSGSTCIVAPVISKSWDNQCAALEARAQ